MTHQHLDVSGFGSLRRRGAMHMWCPYGIGRESWDWVGRRSVGWLAGPSPHRVGEGALAEVCLLAGLKSGRPWHEVIVVVEHNIISPYIIASQPHRDRPLTLVSFACFLQKCYSLPHAFVSRRIPDCRCCLCSCFSCMILSMVSGTLFLLFLRSTHLSCGMLGRSGLGTPSY